MSSKHYTRLVNPYILKNISRYSDRLTNIQENVAEHSFFTVVILTELLEYSNCSLALYKDAISTCIRHDMLEAVLTDIPYSTKTLDKELNEALKKAEDRLCLQSDDYQVHCLVKIADILQVLQFIQHELKLGNRNKDIISIHEQSKRRLAEELDKLSTLPITVDKELDFDLFLKSVARIAKNEFFI